MFCSSFPTPKPVRDDANFRRIAQKYIRKLVTTWQYNRRFYSCILHDSNHVFIYLIRKQILKELKINKDKYICQLMYFSAFELYGFWPFYLLATYSYILVLCANSNCQHNNNLWQQTSVLGLVSLSIFLSLCNITFSKIQSYRRMSLTLESWRSPNLPKLESWSLYL